MQKSQPETVLCAVFAVHMFSVWSDTGRLVLRKEHPVFVLKLIKSSSRSFRNQGPMAAPAASPMHTNIFSWNNVKPLSVYSRRESRILHLSLNKAGSLGA